MGALSKIDGLAERYRLLDVSLCVFLFLQPFSHFSGVRNAAFITALLSFVVRVAEGRARVDFKDRTVQALFLLSGIAVISSLSGPYALESLKFLRKDLFYQLILFLVITGCYQGLKELKPMLYSTIGGFAALTLLVISTNEPGRLLNWLENPGMNFTRGYSLLATFYIPLAAGYLYSIKDNTRLKWALALFILITFSLSVLNNHRSQIVAVAASLAAVTLFARRFKILAAGTVAFIVLGLALLQVKPVALERYSTLLEPRTYTTDEYRGWNTRLSIWSGTMDMIKERPVLGYGYGWKKIAYVARDNGFLERWDSGGKTYWYFKNTDYGSANPHNLVLQILFEVGFIGLCAFVFFWSTIVSKAFSLRGNCSQGALFLKYSALGVLTSYAIVNMANGLWADAYGKIMMAFAGILFVLYREARNAGEKAAT